MSLQLIEEVFRNLPNGKNWSAHLLSFSHSIRRGSIYNCRKIELENSDRMLQLVQNISSAYIDRDKKRLSKYTDVREYDGTCNGTTVYKISEGNKNFDIDLVSLFQAIADSNVEVNPLEMKAQAYILCGNMCINNEEHQIKLISMNNPIATLKNRFYHKNGKFREITDKVLNLRLTMNIIIYDKTIYFMDMAGETLFNMERAYKIRCKEVINKIEEMDIVSDMNVFSKTASTGHNPRRFSAFNKSKLRLVKKEKNREKASKYFDIPLTGDKKQFDTTEQENAEKFVKLLCNKAMWDILEEVPVEVDGSRSW